MRAWSTCRTGPGVDSRRVAGTTATTAACFTAAPIWTCTGASSGCTLARAELLDRLGVAQTERRRWDRLSRQLFVPFHEGFPLQFEGYERLRPLDWDAYRERYGNLQRLDRTLEAEGDAVARYQVSKQADALMLLFLLSSEELVEVLALLGYEFDPASIPRMIDFYLARTTHGSTLSSVVHAWVLARASRDDALLHFHRALATDLHDIQGGTTAEGIHLAAMAGSVDLLQRCYAGVEVRDGELHLNPQWPADLGPLRFHIRVRGLRVRVYVHDRTAEMEASADNPGRCGAFAAACTPLWTRADTCPSAPASRAAPSRQQSWSDDAPRRAAGRLSCS